MNSRMIVGGVAALFVVIFLALGAGALTVYGAFSHSKPVVVIDSPSSNTSYHAGDQVSIESTSSDSNGIALVELSADGVVVRSDTPPAPQATFTVSQTWTASAGTHTLSVRAISKANDTSDPASITVVVTPTVTATATPGPAATPTRTAVPTSAPAASGACLNNSSFVTDVTIPDGTLFAEGQSFVKIWRVRNTGTCTWDAGYQLAFVDGSRLGAPASVAVPLTPPGATADFAVSETAPARAERRSSPARRRRRR
ncbi:MAG: NBR1-Ig-like domain-containing protein, partial [Chloroflexi bacterium]|nr:NBR1-Ig-like domain-containing protein [Chloroflexota bacterium]